MTRYTDKKAGKYVMKMLAGLNSEDNPALMNIWSDNFDRWFACDGYRAYRLNRKPADVVEVPLRGRKGYDEIHVKIETMFNEEYIENVVEIPYVMADIVAASKDKTDCVIDLGDDYPAVNAKYLRDALELLPDGKLYCQDNMRRMVSPVYVKSDNGIALILPVRRENKFRWTKRRGA